MKERFTPFTLPFSKKGVTFLAFPLTFRRYISDTQKPWTLAFRIRHPKLPSLIAFFRPNKPGISVFDKSFSNQYGVTS
ncbi:hypothetical protein IMY05_008G0007100 [Salix suchowensis]|uniref:Uncharacterized protein n=1 Tax=Salix koriyanagi TaxID=2511006 RepID=A0A9Q0WHV9_9ROSI|nr:hypothetical protein IMY05_008G0007100 [Salix suchowensis]KAJ6767555.1 hypothetical protein OIU74_021427 [Salix koriyanagi]